MAQWVEGAASKKSLATTALHHIVQSGLKFPPPAPSLEADSIAFYIY